MSGRGSLGRGRTAPGRGSGVRSRGLHSTPRDSKRTGWEKIERINFGTSLLTLKRAGFEYARDKYPTVASIFEEQKYVIEDMPSRKKTLTAMIAAKRGDLGGALGFENAVFRSQLRAEGDEHEEHDDEEEKNEEEGPAMGYSRKVIDKIHQQNVLKWNENIEKMKREKEDLWRDLFEKCDNALKTALRAHEAFPRIERAKDALLLF